ncbi:MAG: undecaprenyl-phosphate glucose phosphotransferase [Phycisphaerae bacterium]
MLKQHNQVMLALLVTADACAVAVAWMLSYWLRFALLPVDPGKGVPDPVDKYLPMLPLIVAAHLFIFYRVRLYRPRRDGRLFGETRDIFKAFVVAIVAVVLIDYALPASNKISRQFVATYAIVGTTCFAVFRLIVRLMLRALRRRGINARNAAIVGSGRNAQRLLHALQRNTWTGLQVRYFVDDVPDDAPRVSACESAPAGDVGGSPRSDGDRLEDAGAAVSGTDAAERAAPAPADAARRTAVHGIPVCGPIAALREIVERAPVDAIFIALPASESDRLSGILEALQHSMADVRIVPELDPAYAMRPNVSELDNVPILSLRQTPLYGWNALMKRGFDLVVGVFCLLIAAPAMLAIAVAIKLTSPGPVFYFQRRMGLDGREFDLVKFRTMTVDAERRGPVWSQKQDGRRTRVGRFLRRTSLDELPNLLNVLAGQMSLVGPRPERPEFIRQFKHEIPRYMLRHKMKAGMTGYAQIKGLRGDTSLKKRIQHDVYYIRHWSLALDVRILTQTVFGVWFSRHET